MRELQLVLSDDFIFAQGGERVTADETVVIALDGKTRELDLTAANAKDLRELLAPWIEAGHPPGQPSTPHQDQQRHSDYVTSRALGKAMREFADNLGLKSEDGTRPIYVTPGGSHYYSYKLRKMFEAAEASHGKL